MSKRKIGITATVLLLLIVALVWAFHGRADAQVEKVKGMLGDGPPQPGQWEELRKEMDKLTPDQRRQVHEEMGQRRERQMDKDIDDFFKLPPDKRLAELDKRIKDMEKRRQEWEKRRPQPGQGGNPGGQQPGGGARAGGAGPGPGGMGPGPGGAGPGQGNANRGGGPGGRNRSPDARSGRTNQRLDNSSPQQRAQRSAYFAALQQRRLQLGLPANPWGGRGR
jgi:hypothetical protein